MHLPSQIAKHFKELYLGGNWTESNIKDTLSDVTWQEAVQKVKPLNTIAALAYHIHYFAQAVLPVLQGGALTASDSLSFDHPPIDSQNDWDNFLKKIWAEAELFVSLIDQLPEEKLWTIFREEKYGTYYKNFQGIIEHAYYHLGQIVILKKIIRQY